MLSTPVLVLNRNFMPVNVVTLRRAFCMLVTGIAQAVDDQYRTFDFKSWAELSSEVNDETVGIVGRAIKIPRVLLLATYDRLPKRSVRFSRMNVLMRDKYTCQYCGNRFKKSDLNIDHVIPRSRGGKTTWENVVTSCVPCNLKKGGLLPHEAHMKLLKKPAKPLQTPFAGLHVYAAREEWKPFFNIVDFSYWNAELES